MAGMKFKVLLPVTTLVAATKTCVVQVIAPSGTGLVVFGWGIDMGGSIPTDPQCLVNLDLQSDSGAGGSSLTPVKWNPNDSTAIPATAKQNITGTQPTLLAGAGINQVKPDGSIDVELGSDGEIYVPPSAALGISVTAPVANNCTAYLWVKG